MRATNPGNKILRLRTAALFFVRILLNNVADVSESRFSARLEFLCKTGCVPDYFQYIEVALIFNIHQNLSFKLFIILLFFNIYRVLLAVPGIIEESCKPFHYLLQYWKEGIPH